MSCPILIPPRKGPVRTWEEDLELARERVASLRAEAVKHDTGGDVMFANMRRRDARLLEIMWGLIPGEVRT